MWKGICFIDTDMKWAAVVEWGYDLCKIKVIIRNQQFVQQTFVPDRVERLFDIKKHQSDWSLRTPVGLNMTILFNWWDAEWAAPKSNWWLGRRLWSLRNSLNRLKIILSNKVLIVKKKSKFFFCCFRVDMTTDDYFYGVLIIYIVW
jgi:hypothetical protein